MDKQYSQKSPRKSKLRSLPITIIALCLLLFAGLVVGATHIITAHADGITIQPHTCFDSPNAENCDEVDPITSYCTQDAYTVIEKPVQHNNKRVGFVDLRASNTCHTYWVRSISYANSGVVYMQATILIAPDAAIGSNVTDTANDSLLEPDGSIQDYTDMTYQAQPPTSNTYGTFYFADGTSLNVPV